MTAPDPRLGEIEARVARREAMIEDGSDKITRTRCNDPESHYTHSPHPKQVAIEVSLHNSYVSHLEALADSVPYLLTELRKRDDALARVEALHTPVDAAMYAGNGVHKVKVCTGCGRDDGAQGVPVKTMAEVPQDVVEAVKDALHKAETTGPRAGASLDALAHAAIDALTAAGFGLVKIENAIKEGR